jgi:polysaccharide deacetylase 2 family uncharacterized protein YibQ
MAENENQGMTVVKKGQPKGRDRKAVNRPGRGQQSLARRITYTGYGLVVAAALFGIVHFFSQGETVTAVAAVPSVTPETAIRPEASADVVIPPHIATPPPQKRQAYGKSSFGPSSSAVIAAGGRIVIIVDDMGPDAIDAYRAIRLDPDVTLSFLPYAHHVRAMAKAARAAGHEIMLHLPMEPLSRSMNPGPHALLTELSAGELKQRLDWNLTQFDGYIGVNNHMGSFFTTNVSDMTPVLEALKARGLIYLDSRTTDATVGKQVAERVGIAFAERDVFLDNERDSGAIEVQLEKLVAIARKHGLAIAICHPHPVTLKKLEAWIPKLAKMGIQLVPLSTVVAQQPTPTPMIKAESSSPAIP